MNKFTIETLMASIFLNGDLIMREFNYEYCLKCYNKTGKAGKNDDSFYLQDRGPFCENCYEEAIKNNEKY